MGNIILTFSNSYLHYSINIIFKSKINIILYINNFHSNILLIYYTFTIIINLIILIYIEIINYQIEYGTIFNIIFLKASKM